MGHDAAEGGSCDIKFWFAEAQVVGRAPTVQFQARQGCAGTDRSNVRSGAKGVAVANSNEVALQQLAAEVRQLAAEVRRLRDRQEILDCINAYGRGLDRLDAELIRNAFHRDAIDSHGAFVGGVDAFVPFAIEVEASHRLTHHGITSHNCEIDGDHAHAESYVIFFVRTQDGATIQGGGARYVDRLERREGRWGIVIRRVLFDFTFKLPYTDTMGPAWNVDVPRRDHGDASYERPLTIPAHLTGTSK